MKISDLDVPPYGRICAAIIPAIPVFRSTNQNKFAMPSHEADPAALPVELFECEIANDRPQPSVRPGGMGARGVPFARRGFADGQLSSQARGLSGI